ncbi:hypothetical protein A2154_02720 [Candidatus Gottesmanbacteria bacterium RBG_16_43_7]|uniref:RNA polymerase sigma-70 domain-containing protein n=1 Tax=Candidatus Gottesmanbacteria bacterium RBG_16_43_7 TaxID=1798373 RepID=A0A1F5Z9Z9_9BACT|nr:MAG: hypothetical protein A2154_02720 [Candidatus Gottesmanbacteria bacterium RBG_16_43_7]
MPSVEIEIPAFNSKSDLSQSQMPALPSGSDEPDAGSALTLSTDHHLTHKPDYEPGVENSTDPLKIYLDEAAREPLLTVEDEKILMKQIIGARQAEAELAARTAVDGVDNKHVRALRQTVKTGQEAHDRFVRANLRLVVSVAKKYKDFGAPFLDLIQEGNLGLLKAVEKFDISLGYKFSTYASWYIRRKVIQCIANQGETLRIPQAKLDLLTRGRKFADDYLNKNGSHPKADEIARALGITSESYAGLLNAYDMISLDSPVAESDMLMHEVIAADTSSVGTIGELDPIQKAAITGLVREIIGDNQRLQTIMYLKFVKVRTLAEIGQEVHISEERVRKLIERALRRIHYRILKDPDLRQVFN